MFFSDRTGADFIVAGLGNPGVRYEGTRHNVGFAALDYVARRAGAGMTKKKFSSLYGVWIRGGKKIILLKPQTFMNLSGEAVGRAAGFYKIPPERVVIIHDDVSMARGRMRIRLKGSAGGHNGLKSIIGRIGDGFPRIKLGVGQKPDPRRDLADWVLSKPGKRDRRRIEENFENVFRALNLIFDGRADRAMNLYNR